MKKTFLLTAIISVIVIGGCSQQREAASNGSTTEEVMENEPSTVEAENNEPVVEEKASSAAETEAVASNESVTPNKPAANEEKESTSKETKEFQEQQAEGTFVGWVDNHTVAINENGKEISYQTLRLTNDTVLQNAKENNVIIFTYTIENQVRYIKAVKEVKEVKEAVHEAAGTFIGWADNHTIVVEENGQEIAYQTIKLAGDAMQEIEDGQEVQYTYTEDGLIRYLLSVKAK